MPSAPQSDAGLPADKAALAAELRADLASAAATGASVNGRSR